MDMEKKSPRKNIDWEKIEAAYRAGRLSLREIGAEYGCSDTAIRKKAKKEDWERDLSSKIESKVRAKLVRTEVRNESNVSERELVEANAQAILDIRLAHRSDIRRAKGLVSKLYAEVEGAVAVPGEDPPAEILTLPQRVDCVRKLTDSAKTLINLEREAWGITNDAGAQSGKSFAEAIQDALGFGTIKLPSQERGNK